MIKANLMMLPEILKIVHCISSFFRSCLGINRIKPFHYAQAIADTELCYY